VAAQKEIGDNAADQNGGGEEVTPFGNADEADDEDTNDDDEAGGVASPDAGAKFAVGNDFGGVAIVVGGGNDLAVGMPTKRCVGFHGGDSFRETDRPEADRREETGQVRERKRRPSPEC
jgi:hypothetical protein